MRTLADLPSWNLSDLVSFERDEFLDERWHYTPGEHVTFLAPTQNGKSTLKFQLLERTATKDLPGMSLIMKPKDDVPEEWGKRLKLQRLDDWPPPALKRKFTNPPGWMVWPRHTFKPRVDNQHLSSVFERAITGAYGYTKRRKEKRGIILDVDEMYGIADELGLDEELIAVWSRGSSMGCGLWGGSQRPANVPLYAYSQPQHIFMGNISDRRDRQRLREINVRGIPADYIEEIVNDLGEHEWLYMRRKDASMCRVLPSP